MQLWNLRIWRCLRETDLKRLQKTEQANTVSESMTSFGAVLSGAMEMRTK